MTERAFTFQLLTTPGRRTVSRGFTITELLVAIALIVVLLGLLLPALGGVWSAGQMTKSMNNMKQIGTWMRLYSADNDDFVVPSRFNYSENSNPGKVRSHPTPIIGVPNSGTWCDILQSVNEVAVYPEAAAAGRITGGNDYRFDSPDRALYELLGDGDVKNPFRSAAPNTKDAKDCGAPGSLEPPKPFGKGPCGTGTPGFFAANNFFDGGWVTDPDAGEFFTNGQIRFPDRSMYLVDSFAGEVIEDEPAPFNNIDPDGDGGARAPGEVDFRYSGGEVSLMLFLDGHVDTMGQWQVIGDLEGPGGRGIRIRDLTSRSAPASP